jgi:hypothetical protein
MLTHLLLPRLLLVSYLPLHAPADQDSTAHTPLGTSSLYLSPAAVHDVDRAASRESPGLVSWIRGA